MSHRSVAFGLAAVGLIAPAILAPLAAAQQAQRFSLEGPRAEIFNVVGRATLHRGSGNAVVIQATRVGSDASHLEFVTDRDGRDGAARFRVVYPLDRLEDGIAWDEGGGRSSLRLRADGTFGGDEGGWSGRAGDRVEIGGSGGGFRGSADLDIAIPEGRTVVLHLAVGRVEVSGTRGDITVDTWSAPVEARDVTGNYLFDTGSGDVTVTDANGSVRIDTGSGDGTVSGMRGDLLDIDTGSGRADATNVQVARVRFDTGSGDVRARDLTAPRGEADTGSGDVDLEFTGGTIDDWTIDTGSGRARLTLPRDASARVSIDTGSGNITVDRANVVLERRSRRAMVLRIGDGRGSFGIDTGSGSVTIR